MWIDITRTLSNGMIHWPTDPPFHWERVKDLTVPGTTNLSRISGSVHSGTHIDAPLHFISGGQDIVEIPLSKLCGPALVLHLPAKRDIEAEDLQAAGIQRGERVLLRTSNEALWEKGEFDEDYVGLTGDAAMWLVDHAVPLVGIDYLSIDGYRAETSPAHLALLGNGVIILEGLDLSSVEPGRYELIALPMKIAGSEGAPTRAIIRPLKKE